MANLLAELKRRNVFKVATIYVVLSWLILQVADVVFPMFEIPQWGARLVAILLALGFPIALVLAWAFDLTPEGIEWQGSRGEQHVHTHAWDWILAVLLVVAIGLMVTTQMGDWRDASPEAIADSASEQPEPLPPESSSVTSDAGGPYSIAVLPFDNLSPDPADDYFSGGMAEELLSVLGRVAELKVASRTSTAYFQGKTDIDPRTIASTLMVDHVLSGSVRRAGDRIRITAVLDHASEGNLLWTDTYDRTLDDILDIQSDIARSVASAIIPVLSPESRQQVTKRRTSSPEAYDYYLRGRDYLRRPHEETTLSSATLLFDRAIEIDPRFAAAYAGRCDTLLESYEFTLDAQYFQQAEVACHRALTLDNGLWEVRVALGNLYRFNGNLDQAEFELEAAMNAQPNAVGPYLALASIYSEQNRLAEAEAMFRRAEEVESGFWQVHNEFGHFYYDQSIYDEAINRYQRVAELAPDNGIGQDNLGNAYLAIGDLDRALAAFDGSPAPSRWTYTNRGLVYYYKGEFDKAVADQQRAIEIAPDVHRPWGRLGDAYRFLPGNEDNARSAYERAIELVEQELEINPSSWDSLARLGLYYAHTGRSDEALEQVDRVLEMTDDETALYFSSIVTLIVGNRDQALGYLRRSLDQGFSRSLIMADPDLAVLRGDSGFDELVAAR